MHFDSGDCLPLWQVAERYHREGASVIIVAGERHGMGSSRDWAAKGAALLGVRAVLALGFERIHRSNLIGMGILPLRLSAGWKSHRLALEPGDLVVIEAGVGRLRPRAEVPVRIVRQSGETVSITATAAIETNLEIELLEAGGILPLISRI